MVSVASVEALIRECSMCEEHLGAQLAYAERDAPENVTDLIDLIKAIKSRTRRDSSDAATRSRSPNTPTPVKRRPLQPPRLLAILIKSRTGLGRSARRRADRGAVLKKALR